MKGARRGHHVPVSFAASLCLAGLGASVASCEPVSGAAVEVSWVLHTPGGYAIENCDCAAPAIANVRVLVTPQGGTEAPRSYVFPCGKQRGTTPFEIPPGRYELGITALDSTGQPAAGVITPSPLLKKLLWGQPASMDAQLIKATCAPRCANKNGTCSAQ